MTAHRWRLALWLGMLATVLLVAWSARSALLPFAIGAVLAYALSPVVDWIARWLPPRGESGETVRRGVAVLLIYIAFFGTVGFAGVLIVPVAIDQANDFIEQLPEFVEAARLQISLWIEDMRERLPNEVQEQIEQASTDLAGIVANAAVVALQRTFSVITGSFGMLFGFAIVPFWMFYTMRDRPLMERGLMRAVPVSFRDDVRYIARMADHVVSRYIRGQLLLGLVVGAAVGVALTLMGIELSIVLGVWAGITELIPIIGPWLGAAAGLLIVAATDPGMLIWVGLVYFVVQQLENNLLVPRIQGQAVDLHPAAVIVLLVIAGALWGLFGMLIVVPAAAIVREIFWYLDRRFRGETPPEAFAHSHAGMRQRDLPLDRYQDEGVSEVIGAPASSDAEPPTR